MANINWEDNPTISKSWIKFFYIICIILTIPSFIFLIIFILGVFFSEDKLFFTFSSLILGLIGYITIKLLLILKLLINPHPIKIISNFIEFYIIEFNIFKFNKRPQIIKKSININDVDSIRIGKVKDISKLGSFISKSETPYYISGLLLKNIGHIGSALVARSIANHYILEIKIKNNTYAPSINNVDDLLKCLGKFKIKLTEKDRIFYYVKNS